MSFMFRTTVIIFMSLLARPVSLPAAEVTNLSTHFSRNQLTIEYDLVGAKTEKESAVDIQVEVKNRKYSAHTLSMSGDFGSSIALGPHRRITWNHSLDFPEGLEDVFKCSVHAIPESKRIDEGQMPAEGFRAAYFAVNRQTVVETRTQLMWVRNANILVKPMRFQDAHKHIEKLNSERYAGYNDWRIPTREDFESLIFVGKKTGWGYEFEHFIADYLVTCGFDNVPPGNYWTSTQFEATEDQMFVINTWNGIVRPLEKSNYYHLWPVRTMR